MRPLRLLALLALSYDPVLATGGPADHGLSVATSPVGTDGRLRAVVVVGGSEATGSRR